MDAKQIRANLKAQRDQKFRKHTNKQIDALEVNRQTSLEKWRDPVYLEKMKNRPQAKFSEEALKKRGEKQKATRSIKKWVGGRPMRPVITPFGRFDTKGKFLDYVKQFNIDGVKRIKSMPHLYYFEDTGPGKPTTEKVYYSPYGVGPIAIPHIKKAINDGYVKINPNRLQNAASTVFRRLCKKYPNQYQIKKEIKREWSLE